jgi:hypothetical protein
MSAPEFEEGAGELSRIQQWFQAVITHADGVETGASSDEAQRLIQMPPGELERVITRSRALTAAERLAIYANAYHSRLLECLGEVFPMLKRTLGEEGFDALAFGFLQDYPSRSYTLNELGRHFPGYLEQTRPETISRDGESIDSDPPGQNPELGTDWPDFLIDLARLEWAIYEVFDGPGVEGKVLVRSQQLQGITPEQWPGMTLTAVVCLRLLKTRFPVNDYFTALRRAGSEQVVPIPPPGDCYVALTRREFVVRRYNLSESEFQLLTALKEGCSIGQAVESILPSNGTGLEELASRLQTWFRNWTAEGFFQSIGPAASA